MAYATYNRKKTYNYLLYINSQRFLRLFLLTEIG